MSRLSIQKVRSAAAVALLLSILLLAACGGAGPTELTIVASEYAFEVPEEIPAGTVSIRLENTGQEPHHAQLVRLNDGVTMDQFMAAGGTMISVAKGNRSSQVREACAKHRGFYLGSIGGVAANLAEHCIRKVDVLEYPELGMEAIWRIEVENFPAFIVIDDKGNDFFKELNLG